MIILDHLQVALTYYSKKRRQNSLSNMDLNCGMSWSSTSTWGFQERHNDRLDLSSFLNSRDVSKMIQWFNGAIVSSCQYQNPINLMIHRFSSPTWYQQFAIFSNKPKGKGNKRNTQGTSESLQVLIKWRVVDKDCLTLILFWFGDWFTLTQRKTRKHSPMADGCRGVYMQPDK